MEAFRTIVSLSIVICGLPVMYRIAKSGLKKLNNFAKNTSDEVENFSDLYLNSEDPGIRKCRVCGCTDFSTRWNEDGPCYWIEQNLCSACATGEVRKIGKELSALNNLVVKIEPGK